MNQENFEQFMHFGSIALQIFGVTSILGILGFLTAYYAFPPNITIDEVKDKIANNFESRFVIKNIGKTPAHNIILDIRSMKIKIGGLQINSMNTTDCGLPITSLAAGEKTEIPAVPHVGMSHGIQVTECSYDLKIKYEFHLPFYKTLIEKNWHIELRKTSESFAWQVTMR